MVSRWITNVQDLLLPPVCCLCGDPGSAGANLCDGCHGDLPWNTHACAICAMPLPSGATSASRCAHCLRRPPPFDAAFAALCYASPVDFLVTGLKYRARLDYARVLGELLADRLAAEPERIQPDRLIPVPLHSARLRERGFNQAVELTRPITRRLGLPLDYTSCRRARATQRQTDLTAGERRRNVRNAFAVIRPLSGARVAIIDDVVTTGHTISELARALKRGGAAHVQVWACARAETDSRR